MGRFKLSKRTCFIGLAVLLVISGSLVFLAVNHRRVVPVRLQSTEPNFAKNPTIQTKIPTVTPPVVTPPARTMWTPAAVTSWQWQLSTPIDTSVDAQVYDIDLFSSDANTVAALHTMGRRAVCYISVGSFEDWRPDAGQFPASVIGNDYQGWPGEKWLDIRQLSVIGPIMQARFDQCRDKGFDAIEPDNIHGYSENTGFAISYQDQLTYNKWLANEAHERGLSIGLKSDRDQAADLVTAYDWALDEECHEYGECDKLTPFTEAGKAVFNAEYALPTDQFCADANARNFNSIRKHRELDAWRETCR